MMLSTRSPLETVLERLPGARRNGGGWMARCPAHDDRDPSLSISEGADGRALLCCQAGCSLDAVLDALSLRPSDLFAEPPERPRSPQIVDRYAYRDAVGQVAFEVVRYEGKQFKQRRPDGHGGWTWNTNGVDLVLYNLPEVIDAAARGLTVFVVEGEKDAGALTRAGCVATCNARGAGKWRDSYSETLRDADVVVVADKDAPGRAHARKVAQSLDGIAARVRVVEARCGKDAYDHLEAGHTPEEFELVELDAPEAEPGATDDDDDRRASIRARYIGDAPLGDLPAILTATPETNGQLAYQVERQLLTMRAREIVQEMGALVDDEPIGQLVAAMPPVEVRAERMKGLLAANGRGVIVAQRKTGKTSFGLNLGRCVITGEPFLGRFPVDPIDGNFGWLNYELSDRMARAWIGEHGIPADRIYLANLRGRPNPIATEASRARLVEDLRAHRVEALLIDPWAKAFTGDSLNDTTQVVRWCERVDEIAYRAGVGEVVVTNHTGHDTTRGRNSTALEDWADTICHLTKDDQERRYFKAIGRDVEIAEDRLDYDALSRTLTLTGKGSQRQSRETDHIGALVDALIEAVEANPGVTVGDLERSLRGVVPFQNGDIGRASRIAETEELVDVKPGPRRSRLHYPRLTPTDPTGTSHHYPQNSRKGVVVGVVGTDESTTTPTLEIVP